MEVFFPKLLVISNPNARSQCPNSSILKKETLKSYPICLLTLFLTQKGRTAQEVQVLKEKPLLKNTALSKNP
jgi:hypothetical protein